MTIEEKEQFIERVVRKQVKVMSDEDAEVIVIDDNGDEYEYSITTEYEPAFHGKCEGKVES